MDEMGGSDLEMARAKATDQYSGMLRRYLDEITIIYEEMMSKLIRGESAEDLMNLCIAKMLSIMTHLIPKVEGSGEQPQMTTLREEFNKYKPWMKQVQMMKTKKAEINKIPDLFSLIIKTYDVLGLSTL